jgi:hypothetical protein
MARKLPPIALSNMSGGINTSETDLLPGGVKLTESRALDALNVEEKFGYLKRRPAFKAICHGPQHIFPAGMATVYYSGAFNHDRTISLAGASITAGVYIYVGCDEAFDGISIPELSITTTGFTAHRSVKVEWARTSSAWEEFRGVVDFTKGRCVNGSNVWIHTLTQPGTIAWCRNFNSPDISPTTVSWTATTAVGSTSKFWVRLSIVDAGGTAAAFGSSATLSVPQPGVHCFQLEAVNALLPAKLKSGKSAIFIGGDRQSARGRELGALLSTWTQNNKSPQLGFKIEDWGGGVWDSHSFPSEFKYYTGVTTLGAKRVWPTDFSNSTATADWLYAEPDTTSLTKTSRLVKSDQTYAWGPAQKDAAAADAFAQFRGGCIHYRIGPSVVTGNDSTTKRCTMTFTDSLPKDLEHCFIRVAESGAGPAVGEESQIISHDSGVLVCYPQFSALPTTATKFNIYSPHAKVRYGDNSTVCDFVSYNFPHYIQFNPEGLTTWPFNWAQLSAGWYHFYVGRELNWCVNSGAFWSCAYDPLSQKHILTNGRSGLLTWDGRFFEKLTALTSTDSAAVQIYLQTAGAFEDATESNVETGKLASGQLRPFPPNGQFVAAFNSKIVVAEGRTIYWSVAYDNTIWPRIFEQELRDPLGGDITGLEVMGDRIVAFTPTAVFSSPPQDAAGRLNFQIDTIGMGFSSGRAVCKLFASGVPALIGPNTDGVRLYAAGAQDLTTVLDDWDTVMPEGVNISMLHKAVAAVSRFDNRYYLAVPSAGRTHLDTVLVWDMSTKAWWRWRFPCEGVSSISRDYDETGKERIIFGGTNGIVYMLAEKDNDDCGEYSTAEVSWFALSPRTEFKGSTVAPVAMMLNGEESASTITASIFLNGRITAEDSSTLTFEDGSTLYGTGTYGSSSYASEGESVLRMNLPTGTRCTALQYKLSGTGRFLFRGAALLVTAKGQRSR